MVLKEDCTKVGKVGKSHGLQGAVIINTDNDLLAKYVDKPVFLLLDGGPVPFFIADKGISKRNHTSYIVKFDYVDTLEQAERLMGCEVLLQKEILEEGGEEDEESAEDDIFALNGFVVKDLNSGQTGRIVDVADYSGNVVLTIDILGKEILLPISEDYIKEVSFEDEEIIVHIPQEIIDLY